MTTLELAALVATAARQASVELAAEAVLNTLHEHDSWFCRVSDPEDGVTVETPHEQVELFR